MKYEEIYSVAEFTASLKEILEQFFPVVRVRGQISNITRPSSGHVYFTIKDETASLNVVWFSQENRYSFSNLPKAGPAYFFSGNTLIDRHNLKNGQEVICSGRINVYPPRGQYQLVAETVEDAGLGRLYLEFEALKKRLSEKGYFDESRKLSVPFSPLKIAVITALSGAALHDFLRIAAERGSGGKIRLYPTSVQGQEAIQGIAEAIRQANDDLFAEVIVLIRGGGSLEDLWAFNTEPVVEAIYQSKLPVLTGIGHEIDVSLADMVADMRAATPTHAAQVLWPERNVLRQQIDSLETSLEKHFQSIMEDRRKELYDYERVLKWFSPDQIINRLEELLDDAGKKLDRSITQLIYYNEQLLSQNFHFLKSGRSLEYLVYYNENLQNLANRLENVWKTVELGLEHDFELLENKLKVLDPLLPLERGYSLVFIPSKGHYLRKVVEAEPGILLQIQTADGKVRARVEKKKSAGAESFESGQLALWP